MTYLDLQSGSDVRGRAMGEGATLTKQAAAQIGRVFVAWLRRQQKAPELITVALGRDSRLTGEELLAACARGMSEAGARVYDFGLCPTPAMYMSLLDDELALSGSIMVTASHHPMDRNGLKFFVKQGGISAKQLTEILALADETIVAPANPAKPPVRYDFLSDYVETLQAHVLEWLDTDVLKPLLGLHVVVDAGNGVGGFYADFLSELGAWTEGSQFLEPDGHFPNHVPNPEDADAMAAIRQAVLAQGADLGVIFDADGDRVAIVDQTGKEINRNRLIALLSAILLDKEPGATIVTDSVTSSGLSKFIGEWGGEHYRYKRGYRHVINEAIRLNEVGINCPLAIETSGHAAYRDNHFLDDGMYLSTLLVCKALELKQDGKTLASLLEGLQEPAESLELRFDIDAPDYRAAGLSLIDSLMDYASQADDWHIAPDNREGVRIYFDLDDESENGWFLLRLSVHDPVLALNIESDVPGGVLSILKDFLRVAGEQEHIRLDHARDAVNKLEKGDKQ